MFFLFLFESELLYKIYAIQSYSLFHQIIVCEFNYILINAGCWQRGRLQCTHPKRQPPYHSWVIILDFEIDINRCYGIAHFDTRALNFDTRAYLKGIFYIGDFNTS